jgi:hypothetical protein
MYNNLNNELFEIYQNILKKDLTYLINFLNNKKYNINNEIINFSKKLGLENIEYNQNKNIYDNLNEFKKKLKKDFEDINIKIKNSSIINKIKKNNLLNESKKIETKETLIDEIKKQIYNIENLENIINDKNKLFNIKNILLNRIKNIYNNQKIEKDENFIDLINEIKEIFKKKINHICEKIEKLNKIKIDITSLTNNYQVNRTKSNYFSHNNDTQKTNKILSFEKKINFSQNKINFNNYIISFFLILLILFLLFFN